MQELLDDPEITEIMVNGAKHIFYEKRGQLFESDKHFTSKEKLNDVIQQMAGSNNRMVNEASPIVDTRLANGSRVNIVLQPIAIDGSAISIRKFPEQPFVMENLIRFEAITEEAAEFLKVLVLSGYNIFVSGGTGSGKTTFLNALSQFIPREERIITIEDSAELQLIDKPNLVRLETRNANTEGVLPITIRDLIKTALRMRPNRVIGGECRGAEARKVLQAMNKGVAEEQWTKASKKLIPPVPEMFNSPVVILGKVAFVAWLSMILGSMTGINGAVIALILSVVFSAIGFKSYG